MYDFALQSDEWTIRPTAQYRSEHESQIGQRRFLSIVDIRKINLMYGCAENRYRECGHFFEKTFYDGLVTVVRTWTLENYYINRMDRFFGSGYVRTGCKVSIYTAGAPGGYDIPEGWHKEFPEALSMSRVQKLSCTCT